MFGPGLCPSHNTPMFGQRSVAMALSTAQCICPGLDQKLRDSEHACPRIQLRKKAGTLTIVPTASYQLSTAQSNLRTCLMALPHGGNTSGTLNTPPYKSAAGCHTVGGTISGVTGRKLSGVEQLSSLVSSYLRSLTPQLSLPKTQTVPLLQLRPSSERTTSSIALTSS